jgi:nicotinamidase-related amidase
MTGSGGNSSLLERDQTGLLVIDAQRPLVEAMWNREELLANLRRLGEGARLLGLPILVTEQNPEKLGPTVPEVAEAVGEVRALDKMAFSCCRDEGFLAALRATGRTTWVLCGMEAHVCVSQTALDLLAQGYGVHIAADAVGSRTRANWEAGLDRARQAGAIITTTEMALFELLERAGTDQFRAVQRLIR